MTKIHDVWILPRGRGVLHRRMKGTPAKLRRDAKRWHEGGTKVAIGKIPKSWGY